VGYPPVWVEGVWAELEGEAGGRWPLDPPGAADVSPSAASWR
jgi:hypothetical protein